MKNTVEEKLRDGYRYLDRIPGAAGDLESRIMLSALMRLLSIEQAIICFNSAY